jgi:hypothetical protein
MRRSVKEGLFAVWTVALAVLFQHQSLTLTDSAALLPRLLIACVIFLSVLMVMNAVREERRESAPPSAAPINTPRLCAFTALLALYIFSVEPVGYFIATPLYIVASYSLLRATSLRLSLCIAVGFTLFIYLLFMLFLHLPVPLGLLEELLGG